MKKKKNDKSNLEKKRVLFFELGAIISLSLLLVAFEWGTTESEMHFTIADNSGNEVEELIIQRTINDIPKPKPLMPIVITIIEDVEVDIEESDIIWTSNIDFGEIYIPMDEEPDVVDDIPFPIAEKMPTYKGNNSNYFQKHLQLLVKYPLEAQEAGIEGKVFLQFVVDENGNVIREQIVKSPHSSLSEAVLMALKKTDKWKAGEQRGRKVKVSFTVPVIFKLN